MRFFKWLLNISGYLLFTLAVLAFMLWYQFPSGAIKTKVEYELQKLTPELQWKIGGVGLAMPADVRLTDIKISSSPEQKEPLFTINSLSLRPDLWTYLQDREFSAGYRLSVLNGSITGRFRLADDHNRLQYDGNATGIKIDGLKNIFQGLNRTVTGTLTGRFTGKGMVRGSGGADLQGNIELVKGAISFQEPVLGMKKLAFNQMSSKVGYTSGAIHLADGRIVSRLLAGEFSGTVKPAGSIARSTLKLNGALTPRPEFLSGLGNGATVNQLKRQLKEGKLPFTINGTLKEPGIVFSGLPVDFNQQLQGGGR